MDANDQFTAQELGGKPGGSRRCRQAQIIARVQRIGLWWQSRRQVARELGVADSSFRHCLQQYQQRCQSKDSPPTEWQLTIGNNSVEAIAFLVCRES